MRKTKLTLLVTLLAAVVLSAAGLYYLYHAQPGKTLLIPCVFYEITGLYCTGCGITRALTYLMHGQFYAALRMNPLALAMLPLLLFFAGWCFIRAWQGRPMPNLPTWVPWAAMIIIIVYSVARNLPWPPFSWLAPTIVPWVRI